MMSPNAKVTAWYPCSSGVLLTSLQSKIRDSVFTSMRIPSSALLPLSYPNGRRARYVQCFLFFGLEWNAQLCQGRLGSQFGQYIHMGLNRPLSPLGEAFG